MIIKVYNCFHSKETFPKEKYQSPLRPTLLCGSALVQDKIDCTFKDNVGKNISEENRQYSELTGYYWIWKNQKKVDIVGIEHYGRHFIKKVPYFNDNVKPEFLLDEKDITDILNKYDFIVPVHESQDESVYELYTRCFDTKGSRMLTWVLRFFRSSHLENYEKAALKYLSHNRVYRANLIITSKQEFDNYCEVMFAMLDYIKERMAVEPDDRTWGYITEVFPMIYILANKKKFKEVNTAVDIAPSNWEREGEKVHTTLANTDVIYTGNSDNIVKTLLELI